MRGWVEACKKKSESNVWKLQLNNVWYTILFIDHINKANPLWIPFVSSIVFKWQLTKKYVIIRLVTSMWKEKILETYYISFSLHSFDAFNFAVSWLQERRVWTHMNLLRAKLTLELRCALSAIKVETRFLWSLSDEEHLATFYDWVQKSSSFQLFLNPTESEEASDTVISTKK